MSKDSAPRQGSHFWVSDPYWYLPRWSQVAILARTRLPQLISLVPLLGYAVLWGGAFDSWMMQFHALGSLWFTPLTRIYLLYVGSVGVLAGMLVYWLCCPRPVQTFFDRRTYVQHMLQDAGYREIESVYFTLAPLNSRAREDGLIGENGDHRDGPFLGIVGYMGLSQALRYIADFSPAFTLR